MFSDFFDELALWIITFFFLCWYSIWSGFYNQCQNLSGHAVFQLLKFLTHNLCEYWSRVGLTIKKVIISNLVISLVPLLLIIIRFRVEFSCNLVLDRKREDSGSSSRKNMGELGQDLTFLNWTAYFQNAFDRINHSISNETEVVVYGSRLAWHRLWSFHFLYIFKFSF